MNPDRLTWIGRTDSGVVRQRLYDRDIGKVGLSPLDPGTDEWAKAIRRERAEPFPFLDPHWYGLAGDGHALEFRKIVDAACARFLPTETLMLDLELVSKDYVMRLLFGSPGNRGLFGTGKPGTTATQAGRPFAYTNMPFQDGTVVPITGLLEAKAHWYPQTYYGGMESADTAAIVLELARWDYPPEMIHPFYDGKLIASDQRDGGWFTAERIPGVFAATSWMRRMLEMGYAPITKEGLRAHYTALAKAA